MKLQFSFSEENKKKYADYLLTVDEEAKKYGLKKTSFGTYEGEIDEHDFNCFLLFTMFEDIIYQNAEWCYVWCDKHNQYKADALEICRRVDGRNKH